MNSKRSCNEGIEKLLMVSWYDFRSLIETHVKYQKTVEIVQVYRMTDFASINPPVALTGNFLR